MIQHNPVKPTSHDDPTVTTGTKKQSSHLEKRMDKLNRLGSNTLKPTGRTVASGPHWTSDKAMESGQIWMNCQWMIFNDVDVPSLCSIHFYLGKLRYFTNLN